jgi:hypothetical protein
MAITTQGASYPLESFGPTPAIPQGTGGYQLGAGDLTEPNMQVAVVTSLTGDATLTVSQVAGGIISCNKGSDAGLTVTTPTAAALDAAFPSAKVGSTFELTITNNNNSGASSTVTVTGGTGVTIVGSVTVARFGGSTYKFVKTGTAAYSAYLN